MFTLLEYDVSRYISHSLSPRMRRVVSGSFRLPVRPASHGLDGRDLHVTQARSSSGSAQGHHLGRLLTSTSVQSSSSSSSSSSWSLRLRSSLGFLLKRDASSQPKPLPPKTHTGTGRTVALPRSPTESVPKYDPENIEAFRNAHKFQSIPGPTAPYQALPFAGTRLLYYPFSPDKTDNMGSMLTKLQSRYGPIMRIRLGSQWIVFIEHLADIQHAIRTSEKELDSRGPPGLNAPPLPSPLSALDRLRQYVKDPSLALLDAGPKPQKMRNAVAKHLNQERTLANYLRAQDEMAQDLMKQMQRCLESPAELQGLFHRYAIENSGQLCFKQRVGLLGDYYSSDGQKQRLMESYRTIIRCLGEILTGTKLLYTVVNDPFARRFRDARSFAQTWERRQMRDVTMKAVTDKGSVSTLLPEENSLLVALMDDKSLTEMEVSDTMHALMTTRSEASASGLQMLLACMATNTDKQEKLAADIRRVLGPDGALKKDTLDALPYVGACINESLRSVARLSWLAGFFVFFVVFFFVFFHQ
ncbi:1,25-dihydroxyvitamin D(3) 24-hydroxylase, mitochondrial-like [Babylonia areolata]|uniref:1,25-dihydroxyvitamin D(3) 24-hydroxylase, mitochondrial-like n=1 Tax=Babylonia areolata TaxID=304850 RepID=UPI003FD3673C